MPVQKVTIGNTRFKKVDQDVIERCDYRERYRRADNAHGYEFYSKSRACWKEGVSKDADKKRILDALDALLPRKVQPFGKLGWLPAGEGCVRATKVRMAGARYRRSADGGLEFQHRRTKEWHKGRPNNDCKNALDHFWPQAPRTFTTMSDGRRTWHREGNELVSTDKDRLRFVDGKLKFRTDVGAWITTRHYPKFNHEVIQAFASLAPDLLGTALEPTSSLDAPEPIAWTFKATPDKVDLPRILREAYTAGAREVTIDNNGTMTTYCQLNEYHTVIAPWACKTNQLIVALQDSDPDGWCQLSKPYLEQARAWHKVQNAHKVVVKVSGVR